MQKDASLTTPAAIRKLVRAGDYSGHTSGFAPGFVQANLVILPKQYAFDFLQFSQANPKSCPIIATSHSPGVTDMPTVGEDIDIRSDLPRYRIFKNGQMVEEVTDISDVWRDDLVTFLIGCSFSFEEALIAAGLEIRNITEHKN